MTVTGDAAQSARSRAPRGGVEDPDPPPAREFPGSSGDDDARLRHVVFGGTFWFAATFLAAAVAVCGMLAGGWRPGSLPVGWAVVWWAAALAGFGGIVALAWAGCPVIDADPGRSARSKSKTVQLGVVLVLAGSFVGTLAMLIGG